MFEIWFTTTSGGVPLSRQSKLETSRLDDGSKNKRATLNLFGRFTGKKAPANSLKRWLDAQSALGDLIASLGYATDKPALRRLPRDQVHEVLDLVQQEQDNLARLRDKFIQDVPSLKQMILDSYLNDDCYDEVSDHLSKWHPNEDRMNPTFGISDLMAGSGLVPEGRIQEAIDASELATKKSMVEYLEQELESIFDRLEDPKRIRGQVEAMEGLLKRLAPVVREFASSPDLVERLNEGLKILEQIPASKEGIMSSQDLVAEGQGVFNPEPERKTLQQQIEEGEVEIFEPETDHQDEPEVFPWEEEPTTPEQEQEDEPEIIW
jgi:hypothetical protein